MEIQYRVTHRREKAAVGPAARTAHTSEGGSEAWKSKRNL